MMQARLDRGDALMPSADRGPLGLYLHIPFCEAICNYCNFNRGLLDGARKQRYLHALGREIDTCADLGSVDTLFFGGGTPSVLPLPLLSDLLDGLRAMFQRRASARLISGPVGILQATYSYAEKSTGDLLNFLALLSVNLAVVNFLPIPITDGGHFVFLMYFI